jgi:tetratricopeptide (TPR) repeat protein
VVGLVLAILAAVLGRHLWAGYHFRAAQRALERCAVARARGHLEKCLKVWSGSAAVHLLAARAARRAGDYDDAEQHIQAARECGGDTPESSLEGQLLAVQRGLPVVGTERLLHLRVQQEHPQTPLILEALALAYLYTYRLGEAESCLELWLAREPDNAQALYLRGLVGEGMQNFARAEKDYCRAVALAPQHVEARKRLAEILLYAYKPDEAAEHIEQLLVAEPNDAALQFGLARCRHQQGELGEAAAILDRLLADQPERFAWLFERALIAKSEGDYAAAEEGFRKALELDPRDAEACFALASCLLHRGSQSESERYRERGKEIQRDREQLHSLHEKIARQPADVELRYQAGRICLRNGQKQEGRRWLLSALRLDPKHQPTQQALRDSGIGTPGQGGKER